MGSEMCIRDRYVTSNMVKLSKEFINSTAVLDIGTTIMNMLMVRVAHGVEVMMTNTPTGILQRATRYQPPTGNAAGLTRATITALFTAVKPPYRNRASFVISDQEFNKLIGTPVGNNDQRLVMANSWGDAPFSTLFGRPLENNFEMPNFGNGNRSAVYGDIFLYVIRRVPSTREFSIVDSDEASVRNRQIGFQMDEMYAGNLTQPKAVYAFEGRT